MVVAPPFWGSNLREVFCFLLVSIGKVLGPSWRKKKKEYPHLSIGNTSSYSFIHGIHGSVYQATMLDLPGCISCCIPLKFGGLFLYFPLDPKTPRHPQFGYIGQYPAFRLPVLECPLRHVLVGHIHLSGKLTYQWKKPQFL